MNGIYALINRVMPVIAICELVSADQKGLADGMGVLCNVTEQFLQDIKKGPIEFGSDGCNAYMWGKAFPLHTYELAGNVDTPSKQIGIVVIDREELPKLGQQATKLLQEYNRRLQDDLPSSYWNMRNYAEYLGKEFPSAIFVGGLSDIGDGMRIFTHVTKSGEIDGLVLDNDFVFADVPDSTDGSGDENDESGDDDGLIEEIRYIRRISSIC